MTITEQEAYERAKKHDQRAQQLRGQASALTARALQHERWAKKWRDWADDEYGQVPYPGTT